MLFPPPTPDDEEDRLLALNDLRLLDTPAELQFDAITRLACTVMQVPIALISLIDARRQWFKSRQGLQATETAREISLCGHAILQEEPLIVMDTWKDPRFADNPLVVGHPHARFYAGHPIHAPEGARIGTLCMIDTRPRNPSPQQLSALADLAAVVDAQFLARRFKIATRTIGLGLHERAVNGGEMWWSDAMWEIYGQPTTFRPSLEAWLALVHPQDRAYVQANVGGWGRARAAASLRYRIIRPDGTIRHVQSIASTTERPVGSAERLVGITLDITERAEAERREYRQQQRLRESLHQAGMAEIAAEVFHSVGKVIADLGVANATIRRDLESVRLDQIERAAMLIRANRANLPSFLDADEHGLHLLDHLPALTAQSSSTVHTVQQTLDKADQLLEHLRSIVSAQQACVQVGERREPVDLKELSDAIILVQGLELAHIEVTRRYEYLPRVTLDRHKMMLILSNLVKNARDAVLAAQTQTPRIVVQIRREGAHVVISIEDSGVGMSPEVLTQLWRCGFTTKSNGRGFGLHDSANAAREIGATMAAHSNGPGRGSRFTVRLPILNDLAVSAREHLLA